MSTLGFKELGGKQVKPSYGRQGDQPGQRHKEVKEN